MSPATVRGHEISDLSRLELLPTDDCQRMLAGPYWWPAKPIRSLSSQARPGGLRMLIIRAPSTWSSHIHPTFRAVLRRPLHWPGDNKTAAQRRRVPCAVVQSPCLRRPCPTTISSLDLENVGAFHLHSTFRFRCLLRCPRRDQDHILGALPSFTFRLVRFRHADADTRRVRSLCGNPVPLGRAQAGHRAA